MLCNYLVDGIWSVWSSWSASCPDCGMGYHKNRTRKCDDPPRSTVDGTLGRTLRIVQNHVEARDT